MKDKFNNAVGPQVRVDKPKAGQLIRVLAIVFMLAGLQSATQFFAQEFGYAANLVPTTNICMRRGVFCYGPINGGGCFR